MIRIATLALVTLLMIAPAMAQEVVAVKPAFTPIPHCAYDKGQVQLDVFYEDGVHTFCGKTEASTTADHQVFAPVYTPKTFVSWEEHGCAKDGMMQVPDGYRARCLLRQYTVEKGTFCKRDGDADGDGFVDGLRNVPVGMADILGAFVIDARDGGALVMLKGTDIDTSAPKPAYWSDIGNISLPYDVQNPIGIVARSYAIRPNMIAVHDRQTDLLRNTYLSDKNLKAAGRTIEIGPCQKK